MAKLRRYLNISLLCFNISNQSAAAYRLDYVLRIIRALVDIGVALTVFFVVYADTPSIIGWSRPEALVVMGVFQLIWSTNYLLFGSGLDELAWYITQGDLDYYLTKPIDSQFFVSVRVSFVTNIFRVVFSLCLIVYALIHSHNPITLVSLTLGIMATLASLVIYYSFVFSASILSFWTFSGELSQLTNTIATTTRFPTDYYGKFIKNLMLIIPLGFISTVPAGALLGRNFIPAAISPFVALITFYLTRKLWFLGLRSYSSASS